MNRALRRGLAWLLALFVTLAAGLVHADELAARPPASARDLLDTLPPGVQLRTPPLPPDYVVLRRGSLEIAYPPAIETQVRAALTSALPDARAVADQLGLPELPPLEIRLVPDPDTMRRLAPAEAPPPAYAVGVAYPALGLTLVSASAPASWEAADMRRVLRHELSHLLLAVATGQNPMPRWFSEGVAVHQAGEHSYERFMALATASFTGGLVPLRHLDASFGEGPSQVNVAYATAADFVAYLMRAEGEARFAVLLGHLREGLPFDEAVRQTYRSSLTQLEFEWRQDIEGRFRTAPLWAGTGLLWFVGSALLIVAFVRRRKRSRETLARWAREEAQTPPLHVAVIAPGVSARAASLPLLDAGSAPVPATEPADAPVEPEAEPSGASATPEPDTAEVPQILLDGERHTLH